MANPSLMIFAGNANPKLANEIAKGLGLPLGKAIVDRFSDGEVMVEIMENIRGCDIYLIQPTCASGRRWAQVSAAAARTRRRCWWR